MQKLLLAVNATQALFYLLSIAVLVYASIQNRALKKKMVCNDCGKLHGIYMLRDERWTVITAPPKGAFALCIACAEKRWGQPFDETDFSPAPCNDAIRWSFERQRNRPSA